MSLVTIEINGKPVEAPQGATILQAAKSAGIPIPTLCDDERLEPYGACRMCMVEIKSAGGRGSFEIQNVGLLDFRAIANAEAAEGWQSTIPMSKRAPVTPYWAV